MKPCSKFNLSILEKGKEVLIMWKRIKTNSPWLAGLCIMILACSAAYAQDLSELEKVDQPEAEVYDLDDTQMRGIMQAVEDARLSAPDENYTLGKTDIIEVTVMRHPEVSGVYELNSEGIMQYEFVGDLYVDGKTKNEVAKMIAERLKEYIVNPEVTVKIVGYNSKVVYVVGEVSRPGKIFMRGNTITVREALVQAGLPLLSGVTKRSHLITPSEQGKGEKKNINVYALLYEGDLRENLIMEPGDILYIPPTFLTKTMRAIRPVAEPIGTAAGAGRTVSGY